MHAHVQRVAPHVVLVFARHAEKTITPQQICAPRLLVDDLYATFEPSQKNAFALVVEQRKQVGHGIVVGDERHVRQPNPQREAPERAGVLGFLDRHDDRLRRNSGRREHDQAAERDLA